MTIFNQQGQTVRKQVNVYKQKTIKELSEQKNKIVDEFVLSKALSKRTVGILYDFAYNEYHASGMNEVHNLLSDLCDMQIRIMSVL